MLTQSPPRLTEMYYRPMGPLEEGDQAVIDALDSINRGTFETARASIVSITGCRQDRRAWSLEASLASRSIPFIGKQSKQKTQVEVSPDGIVAVLEDTPDIAQPRERSEVAVYQNRVREDGRVNSADDRARAQAIKQEAAARILSVRKHMGRKGVHAALGMPGVLSVHAPTS